MREKQRLFVDMDGTLAEFKVVDTLEKLYEKDYFLNLKPNENVIEAVRWLVDEENIEVYVLSAVLSDSKYALDEKNKWLDKYLPEIKMENRIFPPCGKDKKDYLPDGIRTDDVLLDDYTKNLQAWEPPAKGIKCLNGINNTKGTWQGSRIQLDKMAYEINQEIISVMKIQKEQVKIKGKSK